MVNTDNASLFYTPVDSGSNYTIMANTTGTNFGVISIHDPDGSIANTNGMNSGDRCILLVNLSAIISDSSGNRGLPEGFGNLASDRYPGSQDDIFRDG